MRAFFFFFFWELNCKRLYQSSGKEKESRCLVFMSSTKRGISRRSRAVTAKECTKHSYGAVVDTVSFISVKLLRPISFGDLQYLTGVFCQYEPIVFLPFSLTSPSSLLKVHLLLPCFQSMKIIVSVY